MPKKLKITFVVPEVLQNEIRTRIVKDGYGFRGKSHWISEAIENFLKLSNFPELVSYGNEMHGFEKAETIVIDHSLGVKLEDAILTVRTTFPMLEGVKSRIVRTAILQRLLRS